MAEGERPVYVTRREFYGALVMVWLYIQLAFGDLLRIEWRWPTGLIWLASFAVMVLYLVQSIRAGRMERENKTALTKGESPPAEKC
jgi:hypothetical protein